MVNFSLTPSSSPLTNHQQTTAGHHRNPQTFDSESLIYPGLYSPSGLDVFTILVRFSPLLSVNPAQASCFILLSAQTFMSHPAPRALFPTK
jgi:hypothetical protein